MSRSKKTPGQKRKLFRKGDIQLYLMALPTVVLLILFAYLPMSGLILAFKRYKVSEGILGSSFVGFENFKFLFKTTDAWVITRNTVLYNLVFIFLGTGLSVLLSLILVEIHSVRASKVFQTIYMMPNFLSWAVVAILVNAFLHTNNGYVNQIAKMLGEVGNTNWYTKIVIWPFLLVFVALWKGVGYNAVLYLAVISGISSDYYEAAVLDGASRLQQAIYITLPHLRMIISITLIMALGGIFRGDFGLFYNVTQNSGALYPVTNVIDTYIYNGLMNQSNIGMTTAAGFYQAVVGFIFILLGNKIVSKIYPEGAMF